MDQHGIGMVLSAKVEAALLDWISASSRLCVIRVRESVDERKDSCVQRNLSSSCYTLQQIVAAVRKRTIL